MFNFDDVPQSGNIKLSFIVLNGTSISLTAITYFEKKYRSLQLNRNMFVREKNWLMSRFSLIKTTRHTYIDLGRC